MTKKMAKKVGRPGATTREAILQAAEALLSEGGDSALSFRKLAARLDVSAPSIYSYFENKQALLSAVVTNMFDVEGIRNITAADPEDCLRQRLNTLRQGLLHRAEVIDLLNSVLPAEKMIEVIGILAEPIERYGIDEDKAARHAQSLLWMILGFTLFESNAMDKIIVEQFTHFDEDLARVANHLDIFTHQRLWEETLERNLRGIFV